jgi:hypothetical protein
MGARPFSKLAHDTSHEPVNGVVREVCEGDWKSISEGEINLACSFSKFLEWTMRIHMLTCENITVGPKGLMMMSFTWGDQFLGRAKTIQVVPCKDVSIGPKEVTMRSCT